MPHSAAHSADLSFHLRLVGQVGLSVAAAACISLLIALGLVAQEPSGSYMEVVRAYSVLQKQLQPALVLAGLFILAVSGLVTWATALYGSFRFAGPMFRFARNIEAQIARMGAPVIPIRHGDRMQEEMDSMKQAVAVLVNHYETVGQLADEADRALATGDQATLERVLAELAEVDRRVAL